MRPLRLEVQGLTAFKEKQVIDFSGLDLFAITGPTGAGKTTLVDAVTYALYGKVPRVDRDIKQLISQGAERMIVVLEFTNGPDRYRVHRATATKGLPVIRVQRLVDAASDDWCDEASGASQVTEYVADLLGMDYEGFVRSVLLPQGQFEKFLSGTPAEKRSVLDSLLRLNVYAEMLKRANARKQLHQGDAAKHQFALDQYAGATPDTLAVTQDGLSALKKRSKELDGTRTALASAVTSATRLGAAVERERRAALAVADAEKGLEEATVTLETGQGEIDALSEKLEAVASQIEANPFDSDTLNALLQARKALDEKTRAAGRLTRLAGLKEEAGPRLLQAAEHAVRAAAALAEATTALRSAEERVEAARRQNVAAGLRRNLAPGDPCPVCGQKITTIMPESHEALDRAEAALAEARANEGGASREAQEAARDIAVAQNTATALDGQLAEARTEWERRAADVAQILGDRALTAPQIDAGIAEQESARTDLQRLNGEKDRITRECESRQKGLQAAEQQVAILHQQASAGRAERDEASREASAASSDLEKLSKGQEWQDVTDSLATSRDASPLITTRQQDLEREDRGVQQQIGSLEAEVKRIEEGIEKSAELQASINAALSAATLAHSLASLLGVNAFPSFIRERALKLLAQDGSRQLMDISDARYEFEVKDQEFLVADRWNAGETRPVRTLSGGETFLASLALALALAERLPSLGAGIGAGALESLFIDEGFSHLDPETLDDVASALEIIGQSGERMVGVVTHVTALAERMPARIIVHKSQSGSTVVVE
ncbi:MAG: SMC family ATPase [Dehalococcoidia bacterium]